MGSSSNRYAPRLPQQETKSSTKQLAPTDPILGPENLLKTGFAQKGLPSCPSGRHKPQNFIETKTLRFCNPNQKTSKNEPEHGWRSHFWERMHSLVKEQKKRTFTVPFLGPSGGIKNETAKLQNLQQRPTLALARSITNCAETCKVSSLGVLKEHGPIHSQNLSMDDGNIRNRKNKEHKTNKPKTQNPKRKNNSKQKCIRHVGQDGSVQI